LAAGSGIGVIYKDAQKDYDVVRFSTDKISSGAVETIGERIDTHGEGIPVVVYNPLGWERSGDVEIKIQPSFGAAPFAVLDGTVPLHYERGAVDTQTGVLKLRVNVPAVPALGYKVLHIAPSNAPIPSSTTKISGFAIENQYLRVQVDKDSGCITSIMDVRSRQEVLAASGCGNQLQFFKDTPKDYDAWNVDPGTLDTAPSLINRPDDVAFIGEGGDVPDHSIRITSHWQNSKFVQTIRLKGDLVDVENDIDWHERHVLLKAAFPLAATSDLATYEIPYGTVERPTTRNNSWEKAQFEVPAMRWADLGDGKRGMSLLNQTKFGYDAVGNLLRLTLLRGPTWPDPEADQGHHHFHYALYPHAGTWKDAGTVRHGWEYNFPLEAVVTTAHRGALPAAHSFVSASPENVVLTAVKKAEDSDGLILRVYEWAGKSSTAEFHVPAGATGATITNLMEKPEGSQLQVAGDVVKVPIHPYEILTIRVDYPAKAAN
jgi:alpha-mannosidase